MYKKLKIFGITLWRGEEKMLNSKKTLIAMFSLCMLAPMTPQFSAPIGSDRVLAAQREQAHGMDDLVFVDQDITRRGVTFEEYMTEVIPYPEGLDTTSSGASSAPKEINHAPSCYFSENDYFTMESTKTRTMLTHYPTYQQTTEYTCGPAAALTVLAYYGNREYTEMSLAKAMKTDHTVGTDLLSMVKFFKGIGWQVGTGFGSMPFATYEAFREFARDSLKKGNPILVENVDWGGHWRVIIGYDTMGTESPLDDILILMDPYDTCDHKQDGYVVENGEKFYSMWFDHSLLPRKQRNQPWLIASPGR